MYSSFATTYQVAQENNFFPSNGIVPITVHSAFILQKRKLRNILCLFVWRGFSLLGMDVAFCFFLILHTDFLAFFHCFKTRRRFMHSSDLTLFEIKAGGII